MNQDQLGKWFPILKKEFDKPYMQDLSTRVQNVPDSELCPTRENIFKAYELTQPDDVKVCILGLDPYINGEAHGFVKVV